MPSLFQKKTMDFRVKTAINVKQKRLEYGKNRFLLKFLSIYTILFTGSRFNIFVPCEKQKGAPPRAGNSK